MSKCSAMVFAMLCNHCAMLHPGGFQRSAMSVQNESNHVKSRKEVMGLAPRTTAAVGRTQNGSARTAEKTMLRERNRLREDLHESEVHNLGQTDCSSPSFAQRAARPLPPSFPSITYCFVRAELPAQCASSVPLAVCPCAHMRSASLDGVLLPIAPQGATPHCPLCASGQSVGMRNAFSPSSPPPTSAASLSPLCPSWACLHVLS